MATTADLRSIVDDERVYLDPWEELTGELRGITVTDGRVIVELSGGTLAHPTCSVEAEQLQTELTGMEGRTVSILQTEDTTSPLAIAVDPH